MFEAFSYSKEQIKRYYDAASKDLRLARLTPEPELCFYACYNLIVKVAMAICAYHGIRVKSRLGHHIRLIEKLADYLQDEDIEIVANKMRSKRNRDLYDGGAIISKREVGYYLKFCQKLLKNVDDHIFPDKLL